MMDFFIKRAEIYEKRIKEIFNFDIKLLGTYVNEVKELSDIFLRKKISPEYFYTKEYLRAYSFFYFHQNYFKTVYLLSLLEEDIADRKKVIAVDFGGGPGNSTLAMRDFFENLNIEYRIYYIDKQNVSYDLLRKIDTDSKIVKTDSLDIEESIDLFLFSYTLKEIGGNVRRILSKFLNFVSENSFFVFLDAPDPLVLKSIEDIRKQMKKSGFLSIFPCPPLSSCPVLKLKKDKERTCFSQLSWEIPDIVSEINSKLFFRIKYLKFSSLILSNKYKKEDYLFSISPYIKEKGKGRVYFCSENGRVEAVLMKKFENENNKLFHDILRGDVIRIEGAEFEKGILKLTENSKVRSVEKIFTEKEDI